MSLRFTSRVHGSAPKDASTHLPGRRQKKYLNVPTFYDSPTVGPYKFDSKWESQLCQILDAMVKAGEIKTFLNQQSIPLPATSESGRRAMMKVDFMLIDNQRRAHWWDAKGKPSAKWKLQKDIAFQHHGIEVIPVFKGKPLPPLD